MAIRDKDREYRDNFLRDFFVNLSEEQQVKLFQDLFYELEMQEFVGGLPDNQEEAQRDKEDEDYDARLYWAHCGEPLVE